MAFDPVTAIAMLQGAIKVAELAGRALDAAQNGDEQAAEAYLLEAQTSYAAARQAWDDA